MNKKNEKQIVDIAEKEIKKFVKKWIKTPYAWESETDVHAELYMGIKSSLHKKFPRSKFKYKDMVDEEYFDAIYCKPKTYIKGANYPDLVIYKDIGKKRKVGDTENEPMLWVCEIKYITEWSSLLSKEGVENDIEKLKRLLRRKKKGAAYAAYLILQRTKKHKRERCCNRVLHCRLKLDEKNEIQNILRNIENGNGKLKLYCYRTRYR